MPHVLPEKGVPRPPYAFANEDERLLDEVQRGCFNFLWHHTDPVTGMVPDRASEMSVVSVAGVGFQLSGVVVGVERGWVTRAEGEVRVLRILRALAANPENRMAGLFYHYIDARTAGQPAPGKAYEQIVSTIDSALLFAGVLTAGEYFGGESKVIADGLFAAADWKFFVAGDEAKPNERRFISLGWKPDDVKNPTGPGKLLPYTWADCGDEHRLVTFLAVSAPNPEHRVDAEMYYRLRRSVGMDGGGTAETVGPIAWFPWSGALFVQIFAHCWLDYAAMGADEPARFGFAQRPRVDWWENARRTVLMHRRKAVANPLKKPTLGENAWGLTASDVSGGYAVPGLFPDRIPIPGATVEVDFPLAGTERIKDDYGDGTIAPYGAGCSVMFDPGAAVAAMRYYRSLTGADGRPLIWNDPAAVADRGPGAGKPGYGFRDAFNLGGAGGKGGPPWVAPDYVAIDQGPLILAVENARTGLVWNVFHRHEVVKAGMGRLGLGRDEGR
jgi:hypothetical protein